MARNEMVFFDLETTGLDHARDHVTQIAAAAVDLNTWEVLSDFEVKLEVPPAATRDLFEGSNYDADVWEREAVNPVLGWKRFCGYLKRHATAQRISKAGNPYKVAQLAGHNAATFDKLFVWEAGNRWSFFVPADPRVWDTVQLALTAQVMELLDVPNLRLETLAKEAGAPLGDDAHDALADVRATVEVAKWLLEVIGV